MAKGRESSRALSQGAVAADQTLKTAIGSEGTRIIAPAERDQSTTVAKYPLSTSRDRIWATAEAMLGSARARWLGAPKRIRVAILGAVPSLPLVAIILYAAIPSGSRTIPREPDTLTRQPIESSFGVGKGVDYEARDLKAFDFEFFAADEAVGILHFQASDISPNEVAISVNGTEVGTVPPDAMDTAQASHEILIPAKLLKKGQKNRIVFDNAKNPPGNEAWRIWNIWIEVYLLPQLSSREALAEATRAFRRGQERWDRRDIDAGNRHRAWKEFRDAWLILEGVAERNSPPAAELYDLVRANIAMAQRELDRTCDKLLLEAQTYFQHKKLPEARATLDQARRYFPDKLDQPCWRRAERKWTEYGL